VFWNDVLFGYLSFAYLWLWFPPSVIVYLVLCKSKCWCRW